MPFPRRLTHLERIPHELGHHQDAHAGAENELYDRECNIPRLCSEHRICVEHGVCSEHGIANRGVEQLYN